MRTRRLALALVLAVAAVLLLPTAAFAHVPDDDYPFRDAAPYNEPQYEWWVDEDGNGRVDLGQHDEELISNDYGYYYRNCTDFVAYRLATRNGFRLPAGIGNAGSWGEWARNNGFVVDFTPAAGAVALWTGGTYGHVAWVDSVNADGSVTYEEYNSNHAILGYGHYGYGTCRPDFPTGGYIHFSTVAKYATRIVAAKADKKKTKTSWYVSKDLKRLYIPDSATFTLLKKAGAKVSNSLTKGELDQLPDQKDHWAAAGSAMTRKRTLRRGMSLVSANKRYRFALTDAGNLVLRDKGATIWDAKVSGIDFFRFEASGNVVGWNDARTQLWSTHTDSRARRLVVRNQGDVAVLDVKGKVLWSSKAGASVGEIAYVANGDLFVATRDGATSRRLTSNPGNTADSCPAWSPDRARIAFVRNTLGKPGELWMTTARGTEQHRLEYSGPSLVGAAVDLAWSADGRYLAGARYLTEADRVTALQITVLDLQSFTSRVVCELYEGEDLGWLYLASIDWSPDGTQLVTCDRSGDTIGALMRIDVRSGDVLFGPVFLDALTVSWSPDGAALLVDKLSGGSIEMLALDGTLLRSLHGPGTGSYRRGPVFSPDGAEYAFIETSSDLTTDYLKRVSIDGGKPVTLAKLNGYLGDVAWK